MADIDRMRQLMGQPAAMAEGLAPSLPRAPQAAEPDAADAANGAIDAAMVAADRGAEVAAFTQELLAPFIVELGEVREELGRVKVERDTALRELAALKASQASPVSFAPTLRSHSGPLGLALWSRVGVIERPLKLTRPTNRASHAAVHSSCRTAACCAACVAPRTRVVSQGIRWKDRIIRCALYPSAARGAVAET